MGSGWVCRFYHRRILCLYCGRKVLRDFWPFDIFPERIYKLHMLPKPESLYIHINPHSPNAEYELFRHTNLAILPNATI